MTIDGLLDFEQFRNKGERIISNNFFLYWRGGLAEGIVRNTPHAIRFREEHLELDRRLSKKVASIKTMTVLELRKIEPDLYEAYKIMRGYGASDSDLMVS